MRDRAWIMAFACAAALALPPGAHARDAIVESFDGTPIVTHFFPAPGLKAGERAPTIMIGHGWGGSGATSPPAEYASAGYNVLTWDARGFGGSGGTVMIDHPDFEARDAIALIDFIAEQPETELDGPGDPRLGMDGGSYGGGIQFLTAALDDRVDAITPTIAWNTLRRSLYQADTVKLGWDLALVGLGIPTSVAPGVFSPAGIQTGHQSPEFYDAVVSGSATGNLSETALAFLEEHGPDFLLDQIDAPTLIVQGTVDTLFTLEEAHRNFVALERNGIPLRMMWYCGGHGVCLTESGGTGLTGSGGLVEERKLAWFARYLQDREAVGVGPAFEWIDEAGEWRTSSTYPPPAPRSARGTGSGTLALVPGPLPPSGALLFATAAVPAPGVALTVPIDGPEAGSEVVGAPRLRLAYRGTAISVPPQNRPEVYAQIVDRDREIVVNNLATPVPLALDGQRHALTLDLERVASVAGTGGYRLELIPSTTVYDPQRSTGTVEFESVEVSLPVVRGDGGRGEDGNGSGEGGEDGDGGDGQDGGGSGGDDGSGSGDGVGAFEGGGTSADSGGGLPFTGLGIAGLLLAAAGALCLGVALRAR